MSKNLARLLSALLISAIPVISSAAESAPAEKTDAVKRHPLRGVVTAILADRSAVMVKHEDIPGVMHAMTMMFKVDPATLKFIKQGDTITGLVSRQSTGWVLEDVKRINLTKS